MTTLDFGSLNDHLQRTDLSANLMRSLECDDEFRKAHPDVVREAMKARPSGNVNLLRSAGPISDLYILDFCEVAVICGPQGSGKTIAGQKKVLVESQRVFPGADGVRRYVIGVWRQKYDSLWKATIPSWWKVFPRTTFPKWTGSSPRAATHVIEYQDAWGLVEITAHFLAFGEDANVEDLRGLEFTDVLLPEIDTMPEELLIWLIGRVGRSPPAEVTGRQGQVYGDMNAPDILNWSYKKFFEDLPEGFKLYRQPGGRHPDAENLQALGGRGYYDQQIKLNAANPWWIRRMVDGIPGVSRGSDLVYDRFDETTMMSQVTLQPDPVLPVIIGVDNELQPAAAYMQEMPDGQLRVLAEIAMERGGIEELGDAMLSLEAKRFRNCEFRTVCDPSMRAGEDKENAGGDDDRVSKGSQRQRLAKKLGRPVDLAKSNEPSRRWDAVRAKIALNCGPGRPGYLLDPSCKGLKRGKLQTYQFRKLRGTNDLSSVMPTFDTHVADAEQYGAMECGTDEARKRKTDVRAEREKRRREAREAGRYNPLRRGAR